MDRAPPPNKPIQFSLRSIFWLTAVVCVVLGAMSALGRTHSFRALGSVHAYLALLPIAGAWVAWRTRPLFGRNFFKASALLYVLSLALPSVLSDNIISIGLVAMVISTFGVFNPMPDDTGFLQWLTCSLGFIANGGFLLALYRGADKQRRRDLRKVAWIPFACSILVLILLCLSTYLDAIYIGYGVWVAAMLAMWLAVREDGVKPPIDADDR